MDLQPGMRLADGQYVVERPLGAGGMAIVYLVTRTEDGASLALKVLNSPSPSQQGRLIREGRAQKTLRHEHIVAVTDVLKVGGLPALLMEYIDGPSLERVIPRVRLTLDQVDALFRGVLAGMAAAHAGGFVHRDLKPGNVMLALDEGRVVAKVADFGLVKAEDANHTVAETRTGAMMGTPAYMAPEQVRDAKDVDARADVFALGAIAYELLTQRRAFQGEDTFDVFEAIVRGTYRPLEELVTDVPERMRTTIERALAVDRDDRFASAGEMLAHWSAAAPLSADLWQPDEVEALRATVPDESELGPIPTWSSMQPMPDAAPTAMPPGEAVAPVSSPWLRRFVGVAALAVLGFGGWTWDQSRIKVSMHPDLVWRHGVPDGVGAWNDGMLHGYRVTRRGGRVQKVEHVTGGGAPLSLEEGELASRSNGGIAGASVFDLVMPCNQDGGVRPFRAFCGAFAPDTSKLRATTLVPSYDDAGRVIEVAYLDVGGAVSRVQEITHDEEGLRVTFKTPAGLPQSSMERPAYERHRLDAEGYVQERVGQTEDGSPSSFSLLGVYTAYSARFRRDRDGRELERVLLNIEGEPISGLNRIQTTRDAAGLPIRVDGLSGDEPAAYEGCHTSTLERDTSGRVVRESCLDDRGEPRVDEGNCATRTYRYEDGSFATTCLDLTGRPWVSEAGWSTLQIDLDDGGQPSEVRFLDGDGAPTPARYLVQADSYANAFAPEWVGDRLVAKRDAHGLLTGVTFFHDGSPHPIGLGLSSWAVERDDQAVITHWQAYGADGQPIDTQLGVSRLDLVRDGDQNVTEYRWFDASGAPASGTIGNHLGRAAYNLGLPVELTYFDVGDVPVLGRAGWHRKAIEQRDDQGNTLAYSFWGVDGEPVEPDGYHLQRQTFGGSGWVDSWAYFDSRRQPIIGKEGCASVVQEGGHPRYVDNYTIRCFGPDGEPMISANFRASVVENRREGRERQNIHRGLDGEVMVQTNMRYDERDLMVGFHRFDARTGQTKRLTLSYDEHGHEVRLGYVGDDDEVVLGPDGWAERRRTVDERGNALSETYFDADGQPVTGTGGAYHEQRVTYDALDRPLSLATFDVEGEPALDEGVYGQRYTYDARGNVLRIVNLLPEDSDHWARIDRTYDSFGRQTSARSYDADDAPLDVAEGESPPVAGWEVRYDPFGRPMERRWFGADALPKACPAGFSEVELDWNDRDRTLTVAFRHEDTAVLLSDGAAFPWWGKADGEDAVGPMHQQTGIQAHKLRGMAGLRVELDEHRRIIGATFLGPDERPVAVHGVWGYRQTWDANGRVTEVQWVDREGEPAVHQELGWAIRNDSYDATGELTSSETLDAQRNPIVRSDG